MIISRHPQLKQTYRARHYNCLCGQRRTATFSNLDMRLPLELNCAPLGACQNCGRSAYLSSVSTRGECWGCPFADISIGVTIVREEGKEDIVTVKDSYACAREPEDACDYVGSVTYGDSGL